MNDETMRAAFEDAYKSSAEDPVCAPELAIWRRAWQAARQALAAPEGEVVAWEAPEGLGIKRFISDRIYQKFSPKVQRFYKPFKCASCAAPLADPEGERSIIDTYEKLHANKLGAHWLWVVIEQIAAGVPEDEALREFDYYEKRPAAAPGDERDARDAARYRWLRDIGDANWRPFALRAGFSAAQADANIDAAMRSPRNHDAPNVSQEAGNENVSGGRGAG